MVNAVQEVADAVGDVVRPVADVVGDVVRPVADTAADVLRPVGEAILRSDEVKTVVNVAAVATGNSWAVPIINGADAIDEGADPEDVLKTIVLSTVAAGAADAVGEVAAEALSDKVGSTMANFVTDTGINVVTNGGDIGAAVLDAGLASTGAVSKTVDKIVDTVGIDITSDIGKNLKDSFTKGVTASLTGKDGVQAASVAAMSNVLKPIVGRVKEYTPEVKEDIAKVLSTGFTAAAQGKDIYAAVNDELGALATEDIRASVKDAVLNFIDPVEELPTTTGTPLYEQEGFDEETLTPDVEKFKAGDDFFGEEGELGPLGTRVEDSELISQPLTPTFVPPESPAKGDVPPDAIPKLTPEAPLDIPSEPKDTFPTITEQDLLDPSGKIYGTDTDSGEPKADFYVGDSDSIVEQETSSAKLAEAKKKALLAPYVQLAKDFGLTFGAGGVEEFALAVGGTGRGLDEVAEFLDRTVGIGGSGPLTSYLAFTDIIEGLTGYDVNPIDKTKFAQRTYFKDLTAPHKKALLQKSKDIKELVSKEMADRMFLASPDPNTTLEQVLRGEAKDRAGRPFGFGDPLATFMSAAEDLPDILSDVVLVAINPIIGGSIALGLSGASAYEDAAQEIQVKIEAARDSGELQKTEPFKLLVEQNGGDEEKAYQQLQDKAQDYAKVAGTVGGVADLVFGKIAVTAGIKDTAGKIPSAISKVLGGGGTEFTTEYHEKKLANYGTQFLGTDPEEGAAAEGLTAMVAGSTGSSVGATTDLVSPEKDVLEDAQGEFETIDPTVSKPLTTTYTPPGTPKTVDKKPPTPSITPETVTSEDVDLAIQMLEDAGITDTSLQNDILGMAGFYTSKEPTLGTPTIGGTVPSTVSDPVDEVTTDLVALIETINDKNTPTTTPDILVDPGKRIPKTNIGTTTDTDITTDTDTTTTTTTTPTTTPTTTTTTTTTPANITVPPAVNIPLEPTGISGLMNQRVRLDPPDVGEIEYIYDFDSIFATPEQERMFTNPYKKYTNVSNPINKTDELLNMIGNNGYRNRI